VIYRQAAGTRTSFGNIEVPYVGGDSVPKKGPRSKRHKVLPSGMVVSKEEHSIKDTVEQRFSYQSKSVGDKQVLLKKIRDRGRKRYAKNLEQSRLKVKAKREKLEQAVDLERRCTNAKTKSGKLEQKGLAKECISVGMESDELDSVTGVECSNCRRRRLLPSEDSQYYHVHLEQMKSSEIFAVQSKLRMVTATKQGCREYDYWLCRQCRMFLRKREGARDADTVMDWRYTWPAFLWNLLSGSQCDNGVHFYEVYEPSFLWRFISLSLRPYWVEAIRDVGYGVYTSCTVESRLRFLLIALQT